MKRIRQSTCFVGGTIMRSKKFVTWAIVTPLNKEMIMKQTDMNQLLDMVTEQRNKAEAEVNLLNTLFLEKIDECEALKAELWRFEAALDRILNNCSDEDLVIDITSEALYGDR
jgi:hypothetical protein